MDPWSDSIGLAGFAELGIQQLAGEERVATSSPRVGGYLANLIVYPPGNQLKSWRGHVSSQQGSQLHQQSKLPAKLFLKHG